MATIPTRTDMEALINAGQVVLFNGHIYHTIESLPTQEEIDEVYLVAVGIQGPTGAAGADGSDGTIWRTGAGVPDNAVGINGDYYLRTSNGDVYFRSAGTYSVVSNLKGATGDIGPSGPGSGDVIGPAIAVDGNVVVFNTTTGKLIKDSGIALSSKQDALGFTAVPNTRTVAGHALSADVTVTPDDLSDAATTNKFVTAAEKTKLSNLSGTNTGDQNISGKANTADVVPNTRTVNTKALSANITINPDDLSDAATTNKFVTAAEKTKLSNLSGTNTGDQTISDATISTTDITTNDASTSKHGFLKKLDNNATHYMDGAGGWSTPAGSGPTLTFVTTAGTSVSGASTGSLIGTGNGSLTIPANALTVGKTYRLSIYALYTTDSSATFVFKFKLGSTEVCITPTLTPGAAATSGTLKIDVMFACRTTGSSGTVFGEGMAIFGTWATGLRSVGGLNATAAVTINTTTTQVVDVTATTSANSSCGGIHCTLEALN